MTRRRPSNTNNKRDYPRSARLGELLREILGEELREIDDSRLDLVTITAVDVDNDLSRAIVFIDTLEGGESDVLAIEALEEFRGRMKVAIGRQAYVRKVPDLQFRPDPGVRQGEHIEAVLREMGPVVEVEVPDVYVAGSGIEPTQRGA